MSVSPSPTLVSPPPRPSVIITSQSEAEVTGETASEGELSLEDESEEDPVVQPKEAPMVPAAEAAPAETEVIRNMCDCNPHVLFYIHLKSVLLLL